MNGTTGLNGERFAAATTCLRDASPDFRPTPHTFYPVSTEDVRCSPAILLERVTLCGQTLLIHPVGTQEGDYGGPDDTVAVLLPFAEYRDLLRFRDSVLCLPGPTPTPPTAAARHAGRRPATAPSTTPVTRAVAWALTPGPVEPRRPRRCSSRVRGVLSRG